jgi:Asp-tRNA(Asn)/Glu-tRNA(Gln) amidotransferase A subunit family amidase
VQLVGRMFDDRGVLAASEAVERALALPPRRPV